jgi:Protein of unknown function (DUF1236)
MTNRFMISVAAVALIAGTGFANAQGTGTGREGSTGGSTVQQSAPSSGPSSAGQMSHESTESKSPDATKPSSGMKSTQSEQKSPSAAKAKNDRAEDMQKSKGMSSENDSAKGGAKDMKAEDRNGNMKAEGREDRGGNMKAEGREDRSGNMNAETKGTERSQTTTGQAGAGAKLSTEQRTKITTVIRQQNVAPVTHVDFDIRPGVRVTRGVKFYPLPSEVVSVYPEWRGYEYILVNDQIVVVDPRTLEIVDVINV